MHSKRLLLSYITGFILSLLLTFIAYLLVVGHSLSSEILLISVLICAFMQFVVQSIFFLHLAGEKKPRWNLVFFISTMGIVFIVVVGSIWIMNHLNNNMQPQQIMQQMSQGEGF